jgi:hypothetical protein
MFLSILTYEDRINGDGTFLYPTDNPKKQEPGRSPPSIRQRTGRGTDFECLVAEKAGLRQN